MSGTTEFKDVYEAIASVSPNRQNILYTILEKGCFRKLSFQMKSLIWESMQGGFFSLKSGRNKKSAIADRVQQREKSCSATAWVEKSAW